MSAALVNRFFNDVISLHKVEVLEEILHPAYQNHNFPAPPGSNRQEFVEAVRGMHTAFPDIKITITEQFEKGDRVFSYGYWTGTQKGSFMDLSPTNRKVKVEFMDIWRTEAGKLREGWVVMDIMGLMVQLGAVPSPALK
jgi:predicted ester cyclase